MIESLTAIINQLEKECPGCNLHGSPGVHVQSVYSTKLHYWYTVDTPCEWCAHRKNLEELLETLKALPAGCLAHLQDTQSLKAGLLKSCQEWKDAT